MYENNKSLCRTCLKSDADVVPLVYTFTGYENLDFATMLMSCSSICIDPKDSLPQHICDKCIATLIAAYAFKEQCENSDLFLRNGTSNVAEISEEIENVKEPTEENSESNVSDSAIQGIISEEIVNDTDLKLENHNKNDTKPRKTYKCQECDKQFKTHYGLKYHLIHHSIGKTYICPIDSCQREFAWVPALRRHMLTHSDEKHYLCYLCGKGYSAQDSLRYHIKTHTEERPHMCTHCGKTYKQSVHLTYHMNSHKNQLYVCEKCQRIYKGPSQLRRHWKKYCGVGKDPPHGGRKESSDVV